MSVQEQVFALLELERISCRCAKCSTEITLVADDYRFHNDECPNCGAKLTALGEILDAYRRLRQRIKDAGLEVHVRTAPEGATHK
jgi:DNA-directed RNA polymerase subunit RPC12/RpoP